MIESRLSATPFLPYPALKNAHAQTIVASMLPRYTRRLNRNSEQRYFDVAAGVQVLAHCSWQPDRQARPTLLTLHGMEGSTESSYMLGTAEKALGARFNAIRLNMRNCGGTEHLTPTLYHAGLTDDLGAIIDELVKRDGLDEIYIAGFSLGGNIVLKLAGEYAAEAPRQLRGVVAVSPSLHLPSCADAIELRSNYIYQLRFLMSLRGRMKRKASLFPGRFDTTPLRGIRTIREFDNIYTAPHAGYRDAAEYYERASALPYVKQISIPSLIIHAKDDPFIPFAPFEGREIAENPNVLLLAPERGGHVGFFSAGEGEERYWAEVRLIEFVKLLSGG
ncbi:MAG TPA: alpha/beta fold hydrolase [Blastocatellia bacterium]|nr:alpha/beta fold hydrolase [Blastocatellia bacterium]